MAHRNPPVVAVRRAGGRGGGGGGEWSIASIRMAGVLCAVVLLQVSFFSRLQLRSLRAVHGDEDITGGAIPLSLPRLSRRCSRIPTRVARLLVFALLFPLRHRAPRESRVRARAPSVHQI